MKTKLIFTIFFLFILTACSSGNQTPTLSPTEGAQLLAGVYTTSISPEDIQKANSLDPGITGNQGFWDVTLTNDGKFTANKDGQFVAAGEFTVRGESIEIYVKSVCTNCGCDQGIGKFNWALKDNQLYFAKTAGVCDGLDLLLTAHALARQP